MPRGAHMKAKWQDPEYRATQSAHLPRASQAAAERLRKPTIPIACEICGTVFHVNEYRLNHQSPRFCSKSCHQAHQRTIRGEASPKWQGGVRLRKDGYIEQYAAEHPAGASGYVLQHRLVMEAHLCRYLGTDEHVHHLNDIKTDNRLENLQLLSASEHTRITNMKRWHG